MFPLPVPPAGPGRVALACRRYLPRSSGRPSDGPTGPALPPLVQHGRSSSMRGIPRPIPSFGRCRLTLTAKAPRTPRSSSNPANGGTIWQPGVPSCRVPGTPWVRCAGLPGHGELGGLFLEEKTPATGRPRGLRKRTDRGEQEKGEAAVAFRSSASWIAIKHRAKPASPQSDSP